MPQKEGLDGLEKESPAHAGFTGWPETRPLARHASESRAALRRSRGDEATRDADAGHSRLVSGASTDPEPGASPSGLRSEEDDELAANE